MDPADVPGATSPRRTTPGPGFVSPVRALAGWALVVLGTALILGFVDLVPGYLTGMPRGVKSVGSVEQAERRLSGRLLLPAYFPDTLRWPPIAVDIYQGPPAAAAVAFAGSGGPGVRLIVCQTLEPSESIPVKLLPPGLILESARTSVGASPGTLTRIQLDDGRIVHEVTWRDARRTMALRCDGSVDQLLAMARSLGPDRL